MLTLTVFSKKYVCVDSVINVSLFTYLVTTTECLLCHTHNAGAYQGEGGGVLPINVRGDLQIQIELHKRGGGGGCTNARRFEINILIVTWNPH